MTKTCPDKQFILGVGIDDVSLEEATNIVVNWLKSGKKPACRPPASRAGPAGHYVVTPNPEFIMAAQGDFEFKEILNKADLAIPDGVGLKLSGKIKHITTGIDLMEALCKASTEKNFTVGFLGGKGGVAKKAADNLIKRYPKLKVVFAEDGGEVNDDGRWKMEDSNLKMENRRWKNKKNLYSNFYPQKSTLHPLPSTIKIPPVDILFVAFGHIKQEKWIANNLEKIPARVLMGVGGAFNYLSGKVYRAPRWIRKIGLEWLFRLMLQPWRIKRQIQLLKFIWFSFYS